MPEHEVMQTNISLRNNIRIFTLAFTDVRVGLYEQFPPFNYILIAKCIIKLYARS